MAKLDKSKYTKPQIKQLLAERKRIKSVKHIQEQVVKPNEHTNKSYAFVLGNGTSRKDRRSSMAGIPKGKPAIPLI